MAKAAKRRMCPALGREISSEDCGENRCSRYSCPADCGHNPFAPAHYTQLLEIEDVLDKKTLAWLFDDASDRPALERTFRRAVESQSPHAAHAFTVWRLFLQLGADGLTCAQRWERAGFRGLKNDERVLFRAKMQTRVALLEIRRVIDEQHLEAIDLFVPGGAPLRIVDRSLARQAVRFAPFLTWSFPLPHFWRISGTALVIPDWAPLEPVEIVTELARHLGGPVETEPMRRWLAEHFVQVSDAVDATAGERRRLMFAQIDAKWGSAVYELHAPFAECRAVLDKVADIDEDDLDAKERREGFAEARTWFDEAGASVVAQPEGGRPNLGRVLLGQTFWRIEAMGAARLARLRGKLEMRLGDRVHFTGERLDDLGARMALKEPLGDPTLVPPRLLEHAPTLQLMTSQLAASPGRSQEEMLAEVEQAYLRAFSDESVPALDGRTPREAARDPALRPKLVRLMKSHVRGQDEKNLRTGRNVDINWLLRDLGLDELDVPAPPARPPVETGDDAEMEPLDEEKAPWEEEDNEPDEAWPEPDPLPDVPFDFNEAAKRLKTALVEFDTAAEALDELEASGATLVPDATELTKGLLSELEFSYLVTFLLQAWFAMVPPGCRAPRLRLPAMSEAMRREMALLAPRVISGPAKALSEILSDCSQPALLQLLMARLFDNAGKVPKKIRPSIESQAPMVVALKVVINELDRALR
ncbi:MAG TPA: hypothetical protein VFC28_13385 [Opitutaceae bacterium]|nr:hypothetical protein [Opitutaceae bacterium]